MTVVLDNGDMAKYSILNDDRYLLNESDFDFDDYDYYDNNGTNFNDDEDLYIVGFIIVFSIGFFFLFK